MNEKWIPVSKRLPEKSGNYLVCGKNVIWICEFLDLGMVKGWSNPAENPVVEAWMELPEPYQKGIRNE